MRMKMLEDKFLGPVRVGDEGQIVLPAEVLRMFALRPGDKVMVLADKQNGIAIRRGML